MKHIVARDIMNPDVLTVQDDMSVVELASFLTEMEISGAPVVDKEGRLLGVVSVTDIVHGNTEGIDIPLEESSAKFFHGWEQRLSLEEVRQLHVESDQSRVRNIMTPTVYSVSEETTVPEIAETMISSRIHRVLVMKEDKLVGIITSLDMLKLLTSNGVRNLHNTTKR